MQVLADQKLNVFSMKSGLTLGDFGWGSKTFAKMGREKIKLIRVFLNLGVNVVRGWAGALRRVQCERFAAPLPLSRAAGCPGPRSGPVRAPRRPPADGHGTPATGTRGSCCKGHSRRARDAPVAALTRPSPLVHPPGRHAAGDQRRGRAVAAQPHPLL